MGMLPEVIADRFSLEHILINLIDNALKYRRPGVPCFVEIWAETGPAEHIVRVRDNGRGIAKDDRVKVFDLFRRVGKQNVPGEGIGLSIVKTLVRRHGGSIWCESEPGKGATFSFTIPRTPLPQPSDQS